MVHKAAAHADQCLQQSVGKPLIDLRCRNNIRSRVYVTVGLPSVRLSVSPIDTAAGGFAAECHAGIRVSVDSCWRRSAGAQQLMRVASCWEPTEEAQRRLVTGRINITDLTALECRYESPYRVPKSVDTKGEALSVIRGSSPPMVACDCYTIREAILTCA